MYFKQFQAAVHETQKTRYGSIDFRGLESCWAKDCRAGKRKFTITDIDEFLAYRDAIDAKLLARPTREVFNPGAGDGMGLWETRCE